MSRELSVSTIDGITSDIVRPFFAVELIFDDQTIRLWTGVGTLTLGDGTEWIGSGNLLNISTIEETQEIAVKGANISMSGIPSELLSLALTQAYQGRVCNIYFGTVDGGSIFNKIFSGYMDQMNILDAAETATIEMMVENKLIDLERARVARFTSGYQKSIYPDDKGFDFIEDLQDKKLPWGRSGDSSGGTRTFGSIIDSVL